MADWRIRSIKCPRCKRTLREPVNLHVPPPLEHRNLIDDSLHVYEQQCHYCTTYGSSTALRAAYDQTWQRIVKMAEQKEKGGVP